MPTGYTAPIATGITFEEFAMNCARAFGACVELRDEPGGGEKIPEEFTPSPWYSTRIQECNQEIERLSKLNRWELEEEYKAEYQRTEFLRQTRLEENRVLLARYQEMLDRATKWNPPTPDHVGLKEFMIKQLNDSISFDDTTEYYSKPTERKDPKVWQQEQIENAIGRLKSAKESHQQELDRCARNTKWVRSLRESLSG